MIRAARRQGLVGHGDEPGEAVGVAAPFTRGVRSEILGTADRTVAAIITAD
jgi:hypothetical protein